MIGRIGWNQQIDAQARACEIAVHRSKGKLRSLTETKRPAINRQAFFLLDCRGTSTLLFISAF
jgi:hypothetical protein